MAERVKVNGNYQITIPVSVRQLLGINHGGYLLVEVRDGRVVLIPEGSDPTMALKGLHHEIWEDVDAQEYVNQERDAWES